MKRSLQLNRQNKSLARSTIALFISAALILASPLLQACTSDDGPETGCSPETTLTPDTSLPESTPEASPESTPEVTPESTPVATPESTPEATPESTPEATPSTSPDTEPTAPESTPAPETTVDPADLKTVETFIDAEVMEGIKDLFENKSSLFECYVTGPAPFAMRNTESVSNGRLLSITIPVYKTLDADENGDFIFTLSVINNNMRLSPLRSYSIKINGAAYGIEENDNAVFKMIKVDISDYNIELSENETVAFFGATDTLYPGYLLKDESNQNEAAKYWKSNAPQSLGFYTYVGNGFSLGESKNSLIYDFEIEKTHATLAEKQAAENAQADYDAMIAALAEKYSGKKLSILGDSISTFNKVSNNVNYNLTIGSNAVYYPNNNTDFVDMSSLYWGRLIDELGMSLCVDNAWSGSRVYGQSGCSYNDSMPRRATELSHRRYGDPDLIIVYMGINDLHNSPSQVPFGGLYNKLRFANTDAERRAVVEQWFENVLATSEANPGYVAGTSYSEWAEAYALGLYAMKNKYPNAEIYCMTLIQNQDSRCTAAKVESFNACIRALTDYFGIGLIDQAAEGYITPDNCYAYCGDSTALHPSPYGHVLMKDLIVETLYKNLDK